MSNLILRHEHKYYINYFEYETLSRRLKHVLKRDKHADGNGEYHIRSLYFDDLYNSALFEKQAGMLNRKKYRIRIYNLQDGIIKMEKKSKRDRFISKESVQITLDEYRRVMKNDVLFMKDSRYPLLREFYIDSVLKGYRPKVIVDYVREAFVWGTGNIRITFDKKLRTGLFNTDIFDGNVATINALDEPSMILEIKFDHFLPSFIKDILQIGSSERYAISKYVICRKYTKLNLWEDN